MRRTYFGWLVSFGLASSALLFGACFHIGDQTGTCAPGATCTCDGIGNCEEHCPGGGCHFSCTGIGNCNVVCEGGGCDLSCSGTGNCNLDCQGGNCTSNCIGRTNCICRNCSEFDGGVLPDVGVVEDGGVDGGGACAGDSGPDCCGLEGTPCCDVATTTPCGTGLMCTDPAGSHAGHCVALGPDSGVVDASAVDAAASDDTGVDAP